MPLDDSWIHFIYARSFGHTLRFDFNPGRAEAGFSSMLWVILLAPFLLLKIPAPFAAKMLGLLALGGAAWFCYGWLRKLTPRSVTAGAAVLLCLDPILLYGALSGMEVVIYTFVMVGAATFYFQSRYKITAAFLAACALARPDGFIIAVVIWLSMAAETILPKGRESLSKKPGIKDAIIAISAPVAAVVLWAIYCLGATGRPVPTSYYARAGGMGFFDHLGNIGQIFTDLIQVSFITGHPAKLLLCLLGIAFLIYKKQTKGIFLALFPLVFMVLMGGDSIQVIGGTFPGNRYLIPMIPFLIALQALGVALLVELAGKFIRKKTVARIALPGLAMVLFLSLLLPFGAYRQRWADLRYEFAMSCANIDQMQVFLGKWIDENTPKDTVVATFDAGAIKYFGNRYTIDILSLNTHDMPPQNPFVIKNEVNVLVTYPAHSKSLVEPYVGNEILRIKLEKNIACAADTMVIYKVK